MNAAPRSAIASDTTPSPTNAAGVIGPRLMQRSDREFLPAALEILEMPPSPVGMALILLIATLLAAVLVWSALGYIDIVAVAQGKIQPTGRVKMVQPLETGRVTELFAFNGRRVRDGEVLLRLDATDAVAEETGLRLARQALSAEIFRRRAVAAALRESAGTGVISAPLIDWPNEIPASIRVRETSVLNGDLAQITATLSGLEAQASQKRAERERLTATIAAQRDLVDTLGERVDMRSTLVDRAAGTKASLIDARQTLLEQKATLTSQIGQLEENAAALALVGREVARTRETALAENLQKIAEGEGRLDDVDQRLVKATARTLRMTLVAPIAGTVQASSVTTVGQVVTTGEELMRIVPDGSTIEVEAYLPNKDIGFVHTGDEVALKFEAFPFTRYGTLPGRVVRVATDAVPEPDASAAEAGQTQTSSRNASGRSQRVQNLVFAVTVGLDRATMTIDGAEVPLSPGMATTAEIKTGRRTILEYLLSPIAEVASQAVKER